MPYRLTTIDDGASLNQTKTVDGIDKVEDWWHFRPGNPPNTPNEYMHWDVAPTAKGEPARALLRTQCIQRSGFDRKGPWQSGARDFSKNYVAEFSQPDMATLLKGVTCTAIPPNEEFDAEAFFAHDAMFA